jgi:hypothetical protein
MAKPKLNDTVASLAADFALAVLRAIRDASLGELTDFAGGGRAKPAGKKVRTPHPGWPKCPVCGKNAYPRGKGYCFEHAKTADAKAAPAKAKARRKAAAKKKPAKPASA